MASVSKSAKQVDAIIKQLDSLEDLVVDTFLPWTKIRFVGSGFESRYAEIGDERQGTWAVKIRIADHANQTTDGTHVRAGVNLIVGKEYTKSEIWNLVFAAIKRAA
jgi:hypothetical protein